MRARLILIATLVFTSASGWGAGGTHIPEAQPWSWTGWLGHYDRASLQRGLQVYKEVCAACHGVEGVRFGNLASLGYTAEEIKIFARGSEVLKGPNDDGEMELSPAKPEDRLASPFPTEGAARAANNGALPPDLTLLVKARNHGRGNMALTAWEALMGQGSASGADYIYALLTSYDKPLPQGVHMMEGMHYNPVFDGQQIAMAPPLYEDGVTYEDGTPATVEQQARDVVNFMAWAAEPRLEERHSLGLKVMIFLVLLWGLAVVVKRRRWRHLKS